jgi:hypothetical protein
MLRSLLPYYLLVLGLIDVVFGVYPYMIVYLLFTGVITLIAGVLCKLVSRYIYRPMIIGALTTNLIIYLYLGTALLPLYSFVPQILALIIIFYIISVSNVIFILSDLS